jgi:ABC-type bacteriocin/lantibiotic exporter with double-glycine peptidase domain
MLDFLGLNFKMRRRRVPVMMQQSSTDCGAACLAMVLNGLGRKTDISECRDRLGPSRDGLSALDLVQGGRAYGLNVKAYSLEPPALAEVSLPAIVHWNFNHFVVVERWSPEAVDIVDPAMGRVRVDAEEFDLSFTGVVLEFRNQGELAPSPARRPLSSLIRQMWTVPGVRGLVGQVLAASLLLQVLGLATPWLTRIAVDHLNVLGTPGILPLLVIGMGVLAVAQSAASFLRSYLLLYLETRIDAKVMPSLVEHVLSLPFSYFQQRSSGDLHMRLGGHAVIRDLLSNQAISAILDTGLVAGYLALLLIFAPVFGLALLTLAGLQLACMLCAAGRVTELTAKDVAASSRAQSFLVEALQGIATLKSSGAEEHSLRQWTSLFHQGLNTSKRRKQAVAIMDSALAAVRTASSLTMLGLGVMQVMNGSMTIGSMLAWSALASSTLAPIGFLMMTLQYVQSIAVHLERLRDIADAKPEQEPGNAADPPRLMGQIELRNVSFRYDSRSPWVLRNVSLTVQPGQKVAFVGRSGSGKSTLLKLMLGLHEAQEGGVFYDGSPLRGMNLRALRSQLGVVLQEASVFSGSIRHNIAFTEPELPFDQVAEAARLASIHEEINALPMGYETLLGEGGGGLSGGQQQRVALARAVARRPAMLFLDEATSSLDRFSEECVERHLDQLHCTRLVVSHKLHAASNADVIVVLEDGQLVEQGTHQELMARRGVYCGLIARQDCNSLASRSA